MAMRHTVTRKQALTIALQADPAFDVSGDFTLRINADGDSAHVSLGGKRGCAECERYDAKIAAQTALLRAEHRENEI